MELTTFDWVLIRRALLLTAQNLDNTSSADRNGIRIIDATNYFDTYEVVNKGMSDLYGNVTTFEWTGTFLTGSKIAALVKYQGPSNTGGDCWKATIYRDQNHTWRGSASGAEGPILAAMRAVKAAGVDWEITSCCSINPDTYCIGF